MWVAWKWREQVEDLTACMGWVVWDCLGVDGPVIDIGGWQAEGTPGMDISNWWADDTPVSDIYYIAEISTDVQQMVLIVYSDNKLRICTSVEIDFLTILFF